MSKYRIFSGPYFPVFGLNTYQKKLRIWRLFTHTIIFLSFRIRYKPTQASLVLTVTLILNLKVWIFIVCQAEGNQNILKLSCRSLSFSSYKVFSKIKRGLELVSLSHLLHDFWKKNFSCYIQLTNQILSSFLQVKAIKCFHYIW